MTQKKIFHTRFLFYGFLALLLAISSAKFLFEGNWLFILFDVFVLVCFLIYSLFFRKIAAFCVVFAFFLIGLGLFPLGVVTFNGNSFQGEQTVIGRVSDDISISTYGNRATVILKDVYINGLPDKNIRLEISIKSEEDVSAGDILAFKAKIFNAKLFQLGKFNTFYLRDRTPYTAEVAAKDVLFQGNRLSADESFRLKIKNELYSFMGKENGAVAFAAFFGDKTDIDDETYDAYGSAGILHLLSVSGLHVGLLFAFLAWILKKCHIKTIFNFLICATILGVYAWLCGFTPSVVRAGIMALTLLFTRLSGKCYDGLSSLGFAGILILLFSPLSAYDIGFLLSFSCVISIFLLAPVLSKLLEKIFPKFVAASFAVSISVQLGIIPFLGEMWAVFNFLTVFVNLLVIPIFSIVFPFLVVSALLTAALNFFGFLLSVCGWGLGAIKSIAAFFGQTKLIVTIGPQNLFVTAALLVLLFLISRFFMAKKRTKVACCSTIFVLGSIIFGLTFIENPQKSTFSYCHNFSTSVVIFTNGDGQSAIVDLTSENFTKNAMNRLGVKNMDTLFVLQDNTLDIDVANAIGVQTIVRSTDAEGFENEIVVQDDKWHLENGFCFRYHFEKKRLLGLEFLFEGENIFILRDWKTSQSALEYLARQNFDFVLLGEHEEYASYFSCEVYAYESGSYVDHSYVQDGNMAVKILKTNENQKNDKKPAKMHKNYEWRCLD